MRGYCRHYDCRIIMCLCARVSVTNGLSRTMCYLSSVRATARRFIFAVRNYHEICTYTYIIYNVIPYASRQRQIECFKYFARGRPI